MAGYAENRGGPKTGVYGHYAENNNTPLSFTGNFGALLPSPLFYFRSDLGLTKSGSTVTNWANQAGTFGNINQLGAPGIGTVSASVNGYPSITADGSTQAGNLVNAFLPAAGTTNFLIYGVAKFNANNATNIQQLFCNDFFGGPQMFRNTDNTWRNYNGFANLVIGTSPLNTWTRFYAFFSNSTSDKVGLGSLTNTGASLGNFLNTTDPTYGIFYARGSNSSFAASSLLLLTGTVGVTVGNYASVVANLDAGVASFYANSVSL